jgi:hypothetical protein
MCRELLHKMVRPVCLVVRQRESAMCSSQRASSRFTSDVGIILVPEATPDQSHDLLC